MLLSLVSAFSQLAQGSRVCKTDTRLSFVFQAPNFFCICFLSPSVCSCEVRPFVLKEEKKKNHPFTLALMEFQGKKKTRNLIAFLLPSLTGNSPISSSSILIRLSPSPLPLRLFTLIRG